MRMAWPRYEFHAPPRAPAPSVRVPAVWGHEAVHAGDGEQLPLRHQRRHRRPTRTRRAAASRRRCAGTAGSGQAAPRRSIAMGKARTAPGSWEGVLNTAYTRRTTFTSRRAGPGGVEGPSRREKENGPGRWRTSSGPPTQLVLRRSSTRVSRSGCEGRQDPDRPSPAAGGALSRTRCLPSPEPSSSPHRLGRHRGTSAVMVDTRRSRRGAGECTREHGRGAPCTPWQYQATAKLTGGTTYPMVDRQRPSAGPRVSEFGRKRASGHVA